jgi:hypothetical protein
VVGANEDLAQQPHQEELHAEREEEHREEQQGVGLEPLARDAQQVLFRTNCATKTVPESDAAGAQQRGRAAEEIDGLGGVAAEEGDGEQVEQHLEHAVEAVLAHARDARVVGDHHLGDAGAGPARVDGDEAVHLAVEPVGLEHPAAVGLEGAAVVVDAHARDAADEPVGDHRWAGGG